jgi:hypothetical protein
MGKKVMGADLILGESDLHVLEDDTDRPLLLQGGQPP